VTEISSGSCGASGLVVLRTEGGLGAALDAEKNNPQP